MGSVCTDRKNVYIAQTKISRIYHVIYHFHRNWKISIIDCVRLKNLKKNVLFFKTSIFDVFFGLTHSSNLFRQLHRKWYMTWWVKEIFFLSYVDFFCDLHGPCTTTSQWSQKKHPVKTGTIENLTISLRVICGKPDL